MMSITILAVGGLKERYFAEACAEYQKRLTAFCKLNIIEVDEYRLPQNPAAAEIEKCLAAESGSILSKIPARAAVIPLCIEGKAMSSPELARQLEKISVTVSHVVFVIGGSHGLSQQVKNLAVSRLSMSAMTFPHQLARIMLLEQIYRAFSITGNLKYHK